MIIRAVGFTVKIVVRGFVTFIFMRRNKNKAVTLRSIVFKYPGFTARCWLSVGWGISGTSIRFMGFNSLYGYEYLLRIFKLDSTRSSGSSEARADSLARLSIVFFRPTISASASNQARLLTRLFCFYFMRKHLLAQ